MKANTYWKQRVDVLGERMCKSVTRASDESLRKFLRSMRRSAPTSGNCWWLSYRLAPIVVELVRSELASRRYRRRHARQAAIALERAAVDLYRDAGGVVRCRRIVEP